MVFPFQQVLKMGSILISGLFIIREHQDFCTLLTMHCFLNLIHAWNLHSLPCPEWYEMLTNELLTAESDVTVETPSYWTSPEDKTLGIPDSQNSPSPPPILWLLRHLSYVLLPSQILLSASYIGSSSLKSMTVPERAQQEVPEGRNPLKLYTHKYGCLPEEAIFFSIFSTRV